MSLLTSHEKKLGMTFIYETTLVKEAIGDTSSIHDKFFFEPTLVLPY
jgi:hypothetical protein